MAMEWDKLLSPVRTRSLLGGAPSATSDARGEFRKDYGRVVFSSPLRRLQDKAQVFPLDPNDGVRTRLTHTLEVSSIAQDIAQQVASNLVDARKLTSDQAKSIETIAITCALLHDMGNPPFGHAGEESIAGWFRQKGDNSFWMGIDGRGESEEPSSRQLKNDFINFEGNAQTIRLVTKLQLLSDMHGLNLTSGTVSAALKYVASSAQLDDAKHQFKKHGYFASESYIVDLVRNATGTGDNNYPLRNPITFIAEAADDLAYATVDLEDAIRKKVITWDDLRAGLLVEAEEIGVSEILNGLLKKAEDHFGKASSFASAWDRGEAQTIMLRTLLIGCLAEAVVKAFGDHYEQIMEGRVDKELIALCEEGKLVKCCKRFAAKYVYPKASTLEILGRNIIENLMTFFWREMENCPPKIETLKPASFQAKAIKMISANYRAVYEHSRAEGKLPERYVKFQLITDYICGMTDGFASSLHKRIFNG